MLAWKIADDWIALPNRARAIAGNETGRNVNQGRPLHALRKGDHVLCANNVGAQGALERRIERHIAGRVNDYVEVVGEFLRVLLGVAEIQFADISANHADFIANKSCKGVSVSLAEWGEGRGGYHVVPEARLRFLGRARAHGDVHAAEVRKAMQQHAQRDFAEKACAADQKDLSTFIDFRWG